MRHTFSGIRLNFSQRPDAALMAKIEALPMLAGFQPDEVAAQARGEDPFITITRGAADAPFSIRAEVGYGVSVDAAAAQAIELSRHFDDTPVDFSVNHIEMRAASHLTVEAVTDQYNKAEREPQPFRSLGRLGQVWRKLVAG